MKTFQTQKTIPANPEQIFKAIENKDLLEKWWGPNGFTTTSSAFDFSADGRWEFVMHGPDGVDYPNEMVFEKITCPDQVVLRHTVFPYFTLTITISIAETGSVVHWHQDFDDEEVAKNVASIVEVANEQNLEKLQEVVLGRI